MSDALVQRLEAVAARLEKLAARGGAGGGAGGDSEDAKSDPAADAYDEYFAKFIAPFVANAKVIGGIDYIADDAQTAFLHLGKTIRGAGQSKKPSDTDLLKFVDPIVQVVTRAGSKADNRAKEFPFQKSWAEAIQLMNFLFSPTPSGHIRGTIESSEFFLNKALTMAKDEADDGKKKAIRAFVSQIKDLINNLADYIKDFHKTGLTWNPKGGDLKSYTGAAGGSAPAAPAAAGGAPPPPPPVDPNVKLDLAASAPAPKPAGGSGMGAVFGELSKGLDITKGLKRVTNDMKTKNMKDVPVLEAATPAPKAAAAPAARAGPVRGQPNIALKQGTWFIENYSSFVELADAQMKQGVYIIKALDCQVVIPSKVKSIQIDGCEKATIILDSVVSTLEIVNSKKVTIVVKDNVPAMSIDKTSGVSIILNEKSFAAPPILLTNLASDVVFTIPGKTPEDDPVEVPVFEQFETVFKNGKLETYAVKHSG